MCRKNDKRLLSANCPDYIFEILEGWWYVCDIREPVLSGINWAVEECKKERKIKLLFDVGEVQAINDWLGAQMPLIPSGTCFDSLFNLKSG